MKRFVFLTFLVLLSAAITVAKGPADKILITAPSGQSLHLTDQIVIEPLSMGALELFPDSIEQPQVTGKGYELTRAFKDGNTYRVFDHVRYYPAGDKGYVFYVGIENGWSEYDGKWFEASAEGVKMMKRVINGMRARNAPR